MARLRAVALEDLTSLFTPERSLWSLANLTKLHQLFVGRFDAGEGDFFSKARIQLEGADDESLQLMAELLYAQQFFTTLSGGDKKAQNVRQLLTWSSLPVEIPGWAIEGLQQGLAGDQSFNQHRPYHLAWLLEFLIEWSRQPAQDRVELMAAPWRFREVAMGVEPARGYHQPMREAWLYIAFPDAFENISSRSDKRSIRRSFQPLLGELSDNVDLDLLRIREHLTPELGQGFHFYGPEVVSRWRAPDPDATDEATDDSSAPARVPSKREIVELLKRDELLKALEHFALEATDRRVNGNLVDAIVRSKRARVAEILGWLSRDRLKDLCTGLELDDTGREKAQLIDRILGDAVPADADRTPATMPDQNAAAELADMLGPRIVVSDRADGWPMRAGLVTGDRTYDVSIYVRHVGGSSRGYPLERRFQNPSQQRAIIDEPDRYELLVGVWSEQGPERAVIVAFDAYRRMDRTTRFSMFMPLSLLEQAADTGFATHENNKGETIYAFRPESLERYLQAFLQEGTWQAARPDEEPPSKRRADVKAAQALSPTKTDSIYIRPRVGMYSAFARLNYKPWFALAELVDNAVQSFLQNRRQLEAAGHQGALVVDVDLDDNEISVTDRAGGIAWADFPRAFSPAAPPDSPTGLSEFGLGMKAAACWFSRKWNVRTSALGESVERSVTFDIPRIAAEGLEDLPIEGRPARESDHFTVVTMQDLRVHPRGRTLTKIRDHLASIYRVLVNEGVVRLRLTASGRTEELAYSQPDLLEAPYHRRPASVPILWRQEFTVDFHDKRVSGWAGIMKEGSHSRAGFSVFRRRRLIEGSVGETYKPSLIFGSPNSFASQRVVGEMFVEGFDVTHTKDGIQWHGYEDEILESIRRQIDSPQMPLLDQADGYRARKVASSLPKTFGAEALADTAEALSRPAAADAMNEETSPKEWSQPPVLMQERSFKIPIERDGRTWEVHLELVRDPGMPFFDTSAAKDGELDVITVQINLDHPFSIAYLNEDEAVLKPLVRLIAALALGEKVARDAGVKSAGSIRHNANQILRAIGSDNT